MDMEEQRQWTWSKDNGHGRAKTMDMEALGTVAMPAVVKCVSGAVNSKC